RGHHPRGGPKRRGVRAVGRVVHRGLPGDVNETLSPHPTRVAGVGGPVIELLNVSVAAGGRPDSAALEGIHWRVSAGDYWVVGGLPGSGKSDLLATLAGLYRPLSGTLKLFGSDVGALSEDDFMAARLRIGLVFEGGGRLFNQLAVAENVALPLTLVIACHDLRPWADQGKQFALLKQKRWLAVGGRADLTCGHEPLLHELLATEFGVGQPGGY